MRHPQWAMGRGGEGGGSMAALWGVAPGSRAVWRDRSRTRLLGLSGRTRPLRLHSMGHGGLGWPLSAGRGGAKERSVPARSMATDYKVIKIVGFLTFT